MKNIYTRSDLIADYQKLMYEKIQIVDDLKKELNQEFPDERYLKELMYDAIRYMDELQFMKLELEEIDEERSE